MDRLALPLGDEAGPFGDAFELVVSDRAAQTAFRQRGQTVLLYRLLPGMVVFTGLARAAGFHMRHDGTMVWAFDGYVGFATPQISEADAGVPSVRRLLTLPPERFAAIVAAGRGPSWAQGAEEPATAGPADDAYLLVNNRVLSAWVYRCAVTGQRFAPSNGLHPQLAVVAIRPRELGGPLHVRNFLPMVASAQRAFVSGVLGIGEALDFLVMPDRLDPEIFASLRREGTLLMPENAAHAPDPEHLRWHRTHIFGAS